MSPAPLPDGATFPERQRHGIAPAGGAAARLARSRQALVEQLSQPSQSLPPGKRGGWSARLGAAVGTWWRYHPARLGLELATPLLSNYARRNPWRFVGLAAASGALIAITRPWRLLSVTSVLVAVAKSSQLSGLLLSALSAADAVPRKPGE